MADDFGRLADHSHWPDIGKLDCSTLGFGVIIGSMTVWQWPW